MEIPAGAVIYCDPPYKGTSEYAGAEGFDHDAFYDWCEAQARAGHPVFISEYDMPADRFMPIWSKSVKALAGGARCGYATEKLFIPKRHETQR